MAAIGKNVADVAGSGGGSAPSRRAAPAAALAHRCATQHHNAQSLLPLCWNFGSARVGVSAAVSSENSGAVWQHINISSISGSAKAAIMAAAASAVSIVAGVNNGMVIESVAGIAQAWHGMVYQRAKISNNGENKGRNDAKAGGERRRLAITPHTHCDAHARCTRAAPAASGAS